MVLKKGKVGIRLFGTSVYIRHADNKTPPSSSNATNNVIYVRPSTKLPTPSALLTLIVRSFLREPQKGGRGSLLIIIIVEGVLHGVSPPPHSAYDPNLLRRLSTKM